MTREASLKQFVDYCKAYIKGDERGEAQIFLDRLFTALGYPAGIKEAQGSAETRIKFTLDEKSPTKFADLVIPGRVLVEMKKRGVALKTTQLQALDYWKYLTPHPRYVVTCNFDEFWVYDMEQQVDAPMGKIALESLPESWGPLAFLFPQPQTPVFSAEFNLVELPRDAAVKLGQVFHSLTKSGRSAGQVSREHAQQFVLQCMVAMFAEDIGLLPRYMFTRLLDEAEKDISRSPQLFTTLFFAMNTPDAKGGLYHDVAYFNGGLFDFRRIHVMLLQSEEIRLLREAAGHNWANIRPAIFGTIFEESLREETRHAAGIHFTSERDILRIVEPVIEHPWLERIDRATTEAELAALHDELCRYIVLDPACGSGNFLYMAYRAMKRLEERIIARLGRRPERAVSVKQFYGYDTDAFAVELARVTLMIAKKLAVDEGHSTEPTLPLDNLDANIRAEDALFADWPDFDAAIGNPPYLGAKRLKQEMPAAYINQVRAAFPDVPGNADYCVYWFNKAHRRMKPGARAGLVGTNTIRQNYSREGGLDIITAEGGRIFEAVSSMPWSGDAAVHVSIACWEKLPPQPLADLPHPPAPYPASGEGEEENTSLQVPSPLVERAANALVSVGGEDIVSQGEAQAASAFSPPSLRSGEGGRGGEVARLWIDDGETALDLPYINSSLSPKTDVSRAAVLTCNTTPKRVFQGQIPGNEEFVLSPEEAAAMIRKDPASSAVIFPFLIGRDLVANPKGQPSRYVIDMGEHDVLDAGQFKAAFKHVQEKILPLRETKAKAEAEKNATVLAANSKARINRHHEMFLRQWWKHSYGRLDMLAELRNLSRYVVCPEVSKRPIFDFVSPAIRPDHKLIVFAFEDDYSFGILQSDLHHQWWLAKGATLKSDPAYTPNSVYDTFPWPQHPSPAQVKAVADAARALHSFRRQRMERGERVTLRDMYRSLEQPGSNPLMVLHAALDSAVAAAYAFSPRPAAEGPRRVGEGAGVRVSSGEDALSQLLTLNQTVAARIKAGESVTAPGIPADYPNPAELVSEGCITPRELL